MRQGERELLHRLSEQGAAPSLEIRVYEGLRSAFDSLDDLGRKRAAIRASKRWRALSFAEQQDHARLLSGLWKYHLSANDLPRTERVANLIVRIGEKTKRPILKAEGLLARAMALVAKGALVDAVRTFELSRALFASRSENRHDLIRASLSLGAAYRRIGDRTSALAVLQRTRRDSLETEDISSLASASQGLGILSVEAGDLDLAVEYFTFVRRSSELLGSSRRTLRAVLGLALSYLRKGDLDLAEEAAATALREASEMQLPREIALAHEYLGEIASKRDEWGLALRYYSLVNKFAITPPAADVRVELHRRLVEFWMRKGNSRYTKLHIEKGLELTGDAEDLMALRRLKFEMEWKVSGAPEAIEGLTQLAAECSRAGLGYEYLLISLSLSMITLKVGLDDQSLVWWRRASSMAVLKGAEGLLEDWEREREVMLRKGGREGSVANDHETRLWRELPKIDLSQHGIVTKTRAMIEGGALIARIAPTRIPVLISGESGTGKELFASLVHSLSPRNKEPFLAVNCAAMPGELIESELFGHRRGSFTGAVVDKEGLFRSADRGTIFLDEIGEMPTATQSKLLRVLETGEIRRIGDTAPQNVDVRVVAATNQDLKEAVRKGSFRRDLFFRLRGLEIQLPPLRQRLLDIPLLADFFLDLINRDRKTRITLPNETKQWLVGHQWPGNVRELKWAIERAAAIAPPVGPLHPYHFVYSEISDKRGSLTEELKEIEKVRVRNALEATGWNVTSAADLLGLTRTTLSSRLKRLGIQRPEN